MAAAPQRRSPAAVAHRNPPPRRSRNPASPFTAIPPLVAAATFIAGTAAHIYLPVAVTIPVAVVAAAGAASAVHRRNLPGGSAAVAAAFAVFVAAATGPSLWTLLLAVVVAVVATRRINRMPQFVRARRMAQIGDAWPVVAEALGDTRIGLAGPVADRGPFRGFALPISCPPGRNLKSLRGREDDIASALRAAGIRVPVSAVAVVVDDNWPSSGYIHIREGDPAATATPEVLNPTISSGAEPLPFALYPDGVVYHLWIFVEGQGAVDKLFAGDTGSGKSSALIRVLKLVVGLPDVAIVALDGANGRDLGPWQGCFFRYYSEPRDVLMVAQTLVKIVELREKTMRDNGWRVWRPSAEHPILLVPIDEMATFGNSTYGPEIARCFNQIGTKDRAVGVEVIGLTQHAIGLNALGGEFRANIPDRLQFHDQEMGASTLQDTARTPIPKDGYGMFHGESYGESRKVPAQVIWTPDEERGEIIAEWAGNQTRIDDEWAAADIAAHGSMIPVAVPTAAPQPSEIAAEPVIEGEIVVGNVMFPPLHDLPSRRDPKGYDEGVAACKILLRDAGQATSGQMEELTGWDFAQVRDHVTRPAINFGWLKTADDDSGTLVYRPVREWLQAERAAASK